ncbi:MAG: hypothetical protein H0W35_05965 [Actinobacteria bacterium]|nr:hypothetical protein [Actinomycetota bacterium]MDQ3382032.1 hypothetical protein [Actinomycetota bacterium]
METRVWIVIAAVVAAAALVLVLALVSVGRKKRQRAHLQERFGPEYDRAVSDSGRRDGERRLTDVERDHDELDIRPLSEAARERYLEEWRQAEARFVNDPKDAARSAERVVERVLADRGYPADTNAETQAVHVAVDRPDVVERYRHGHAMLASENGDQDTENLRKAMLDFRSVFDELVTDDTQTAA